MLDSARTDPAVYKLLADAPAPEAVPRLVRYAAGEPDTDLVVHAVRVLRAAKTPPAVEALIALTAHPSWRVRAEAIDAAAEIVNAAKARLAQSANSSGSS